MRKNNLLKLDDQIIKLVHYSTTEGLSELDVNKMGTGIPAQESKYGVPNCKYICFYREGSVTESGESEDLDSIAKYFAILNSEQKLYDLSIDPDGIWIRLKESGNTINKGIARSDEYKQAVKDVGYYGFYNSQHCNIGLSNSVCLFYSHPVEEDLTFHSRRIKQVPKLNFAEAYAQVLRSKF